MRSYTIWGKSA